MPLDAEKMQDALDVLSQSIGGDPRSSYKIRVVEQQLRAVPLDPEIDEVLVWTEESGWEWSDLVEEDRQKTKIWEDFDWWWMMVKTHCRLKGLDPQGPWDEDREAHAEGRSTWAHSVYLRTGALPS